MFIFSPFFFLRHSLMPFSFFSHCFHYCHATFFHCRHCRSLIRIAPQILAEIIRGAISLRYDATFTFDDISATLLRQLVCHAAIIDITLMMMPRLRHTADIANIYAAIELRCIRRHYMVALLLHC